MRIGIVGAGGVGGYFGARLAQAGSDVGFLARGQHLAAIRRHGLRIEHGAQSFHVRDLHATANPAELGQVDVVLLCVKLWDTDTVLKQIHSMVGPNTTVASLQNGVLKDSVLQAALNPAQVVGAVTYVASTISRPGVIVRTGPLERLIFGEFDGRRTARIEALLDICMVAGIDGQASEDIRRETWEKFVFLVGLSSTTATISQPIGPIRSNRQTRAFLLDLMREVVAVAIAHGVALSSDCAEKRLKLLDGVAAETTSSMARDLAQGKRLELPWLSGAVVNLGKEVGVDTPLNRAVTDILAFRVDGHEE